MINKLLKPPFLGILIILMMIGEKFLAHTYTVITIYVLPGQWKFWVPFIMGLLGFWLVLRGLGRDEVRGSLLGYLGAVLIWMSWFESALPVLGDAAGIAPILPETGNKMAGLMGGHVILQASGIFCFVALFLIMLNKDVRCRMLLWIRRKSKLEVGKPTSGYRPNVARVAAFEYIFVTWFMYVVMLVIVDPRLFGLYHWFTYTISAAISLWGIYLIYKLTKQREVGLAIRYGIGAVGVFWYIPELLALYELWYEFYLYANRHPIAMTAVLAVFIATIVILMKTPVNEQTGRSEVK